MQHDAFTEEDTELLLHNAKHILAVSPDAEDEMWSELADSKNKQSAKEWKDYFHTFVRPIYESKLKRKKPAAARTSNVSDTAVKLPKNIKALGNEQNNETGSSIQQVKYKRRRTLPNSFGTNGFSTDVDALDLKGKRRATDYGSRTMPPPPSSISKAPSTSSRNIAVDRPEQDETAPRHGSHQISHPSTTTPHSSKPPSTPKKAQHNVSEEQDEGADQVDEWIKFTLERHGGLISEEQVKTALLCTTLDPILAENVLLSFKAGEGIPTNVRGIWTESDDDHLQGEDPEAIARVEVKHGWREVDSRFEHLTERNEESYGELWMSEKAYTIKPVIAPMF
ncbi:uncharacterized protein GIQ15_00845 [Arthroderma uncinatum]|uniref:uncharacterized protein n=1 Tax=Arthroderma uncinatum TaxID=74035 RepID=UPI00144A53C3|nr:uncharacterized protein GIQ15_00845 [Arthroderma uncinatum]KAF3491328.1 hypothetical protein GIQ15_00845 [Arthroderma uncinatum]